MSAIRPILLFLLLGLTLLTLTISQLDNLTTSKVYTAALQLVSLDLKTLNISAVQISDYGHMVAGFVLTSLALLLVHRWWVVAVMLLFFVGIEAAQFLTVERQPSWLDVLRGWSGVLGAWFLARLFRGKVKGPEGVRRDLRGKLN